MLAGDMCAWNWVTQLFSFSFDSIHRFHHFKMSNSRIANNHLWTLTAFFFRFKLCAKILNKAKCEQWCWSLKYYICTLQTPEILAAKMKRKKRRSHFWYIEKQMLIFISTLKRFGDTILLLIAVSRYPKHSRWYLTDFLVLFSSCTVSSLLFTFDDWNRLASVVSIRVCVCALLIIEIFIYIFLVSPSLCQIKMCGG